MTAKWGAKHDAIMAEYRADVKAGKIKEVVLIPKD